MARFRLIVGDVRERLRDLPPGSVQCVVTSPPYWGLRDYGVAGQIGLERTPEEYVAKMVEVFREVRRVLRPDGTTTGVVALKRGRDFWGIDLKPEYAAMAERRIRNVTPEFPSFSVARSHAPGEDGGDDAAEAEPDEGPASQAVDA